ncbi:MAG: nodulation protein NfeD [Euryarchaeota archaeon]|nr:nodulation protein NfeD [Euryarchaeota archaeon]MBU4340700.1 nodulation protein NfeD [Euryarchaeota archaeon]MBU4453514.1 nodulation protein NfeD [Euryarchaeota archaeon]MCG2737800.1 nodulation protein NfeD [Candidatus Methanoperedenaceae archaeon]
MKAFFLFFLFIGLLQAAGAQVIVVELNDAITPASDDIVSEALANAQVSDAQALIITMNTPGGGLDETKKILDLIQNSPVPVIGYVYPKGATAWSAGTIILLATDVAAMAPNSIIGSAQPVEMSGEGIKPIKEEKIINAIVALAREKAKQHGRNESAAEQFITANLNLDAEEAKEMKVIEVIASDIEDLLVKVDGMTVKGKVLKTSGVEYRYHSPSMRLMIMSTLSNPILASLLLFIGIYSLIFGLTSPGYGAEIFGVIALSLGLIGLGFSINVTGLFLIAFGIGLILFELHISTFGIFGVAGIACVALGSILLVPTGYPNMYSPEFQTSLLISLFIPAVILGGFLALGIYKVMEIRRKRPVIGEILGDTAKTIDAITPDGTGYVRYQGELWLAKSRENIEPGMKVVIRGKDGSVLVVEMDEIQN